MDNSCILVVKSRQVTVIYVVQIVSKQLYSSFYCHNSIEIIEMILWYIYS